MTRTMLMIALLVPAAAHAQLFKCTGPDGKIVYSDTRCEASSKGALKVTPMGTTPSEKELADAAAKAKERIQNLEVGNTRMGAYDEQKTAASLEMSAIRSGLDARMPSDAKSKRDGLVTDLSSTDAKKRKDSLNKLRELYSNY